ncbi:hypothetical protein NKG05_06140 [Oerskovia sp. M15]
MTRTLSDMSSRPRSVAIAATDGMLHFELAMAYEVFGSAPDAVPGPWYDVSVCGTRSVRAGTSSWSRTAGSIGWPTPHRHRPRRGGRRRGAAGRPGPGGARGARGGARVVSCALARSSWQPPVCWTGCATTHWAHTEELAALPAGDRRPRRALRGQR